ECTDGRFVENRQPKRPGPAPNIAALSTRNIDRFARRSVFGVLLEEFHRIADGQDRFGRVIRDFAAELLFERHDKLDGVETVRAEVIDETRGVGHLVRLHAKVLHDDLLYPLANVTHFLKPRAPLDWLGRSTGPAILPFCNRTELQTFNFAS